MPESKNRPYARTYIIEFKDGSIKIIDGLDIAIPAAGRIHSTGTQEVLASCNFLAFRTRDSRDTILISADTIKSIQITDERENPREEFVKTEMGWNKL